MVQPMKAALALPVERAVLEDVASVRPVTSRDVLGVKAETKAANSS